jgi:hypothetical protein
MPTVSQYKKRITLGNNPTFKKMFGGGIEEKFGNIIEQAIDKVLPDILKAVVKEAMADDRVMNTIIATVYHSIRQPEDGVDGVDGKNGRDGVDGENGRDGKNGVDGRTPIKGLDYFNELDKQEFIENIKQSIEKLSGEEIVQLINDLPIEPSKQIDAKHIKNLPETKREGTKLGGGIARGGMKLAWNVVLEGSVNGTNTVFTIPASQPNPVDNKYIVEARGGFKSADNGDFTVSNSNRTITFTQAPPNGSNQPRIAIYQAH